MSEECPGRPTCPILRQRYGLDDVVRLVSYALGYECDDPIWVATHLATCHDCRTDVAAIREQPTPSARLKRALMARIGREIRAATTSSEPRR